MSYEAVNALIEEVSSRLLQTDPGDIRNLSGLLPVLKRAYACCMKISLKKPAKKILKTRVLIENILDHDPEDVRGQIRAIVQEINRIKDDLKTGRPAGDMPAGARVKSPLSDGQKKIAVLEEAVVRMGRLIGIFCPEKGPDIERMLDNMDLLLDASEDLEPSTFYDIIRACKSYVESMDFQREYRTRPIEETHLLLKAILSHMKKGIPFTFDYSDVVDLLRVFPKGASLPEPPKQHVSDPTPDKSTGTEDEVPEKIADSDMEILSDFIGEAEENLDAIEVSLMELENDPSNMDIINDIFRPFHTIKGVSGFLTLSKMNTLAHATENLLDGARNRDFIIDQNVTDTILESVDTLKKLVERLKSGIPSGVKLPTPDIDVKLLQKKMQELQITLTRGDKKPIGEILVKNKAIDEETLDQALEIQQSNPGRKIGEILVNKKMVQAEQVAAALMDQNQNRKKTASQVKVSTRKLDDLVDYAGELVIAQSMLRQKTLQNPDLSQSVAQLGQIVDNMQNLAMSMRMIPIKATFMKMIRLVRDLSKKSDKNVTLQMVGEDTEIDRNVVDALYDPMVHMIRNSVDHGIEHEADRLKKGKSGQGTIFLRAYHKGGHIFIEIEDDGRGLDRERILEKAEKTGLVNSGEPLTDTRVFDLILEPGFSTARQITDVSGRGVGMDVVRETIEKFRGNLNIESQKDIRTRFIISLPLTMAIIDGMLVRVDDQKYVIPTIAVQKAFKPLGHEYFTVEGKAEMVRDRGSLIPLIRLDEIYGTGSRRKAVKDCLVVVAESKEEKRGLLIDELLGKDEYVIKSLGNNLEDVEGLAGGAILADGRVGLILDIHGIFSIAGKE